MHASRVPHQMEPVRCAASGKGSPEEGGVKKEGDCRAHCWWVLPMAQSSRRLAACQTGFQLRYARLHTTGGTRKRHRQQQAEGRGCWLA